MTSDPLSQAVSLIKSGNKEAGKNLLIKLVKTDPYNENAWLWLASVTSGEQRIYGLQKALAINPQNEKARTYLDKLKPPTPPQKWQPQQAPAPQPSSDKHLPTGKITLKPNWSKIILVWLITSIFGILSLLVTGSELLLDIGVFFILILLMLVRSFFITIIFFVPPWIKVELTNETLSGPSWWSPKVKTPIRNLDLQTINSTFAIIGFYVIKPIHKEKKILLFGFNEDQYDLLIDLIPVRQAGK
ncbi:MAG: hypothetical protein JEZ00_20115 [Anaerolineaceae bacterium]|nr:hypothetical protein [Anaerolineaceae bacterium]